MRPAQPWWQLTRCLQGCSLQTAAQPLASLMLSSPVPAHSAAKSSGSKNTLAKAGATSLGQQLIPCKIKHRPSVDRKVSLDQTVCQEPGISVHAPYLCKAFLQHPFKLLHTPGVVVGTVCSRGSKLRLHLALSIFRHFKACLDSYCCIPGKFQGAAAVVVFPLVGRQLSCLRHCGLQPITVDRIMIQTVAVAADCLHNSNAAE